MRQNTAMYLIASTVLAAIAALLTLGIIWLVPDADPKTVVGFVFGAVISIVTAMAYFQARETHLSVNSRLDAFMRDNALVAFEKGRQEGEEKEIARNVSKEGQ